MSMTSSTGHSEQIEIEDTGIAWPAIIGGTVAAAATLLLLAPLGLALGVHANLPWQSMDSGEKTFALISAVWLIVLQWVSSGVGGYLTGRLRTAWPGAHTHEVFFRDTVHGFLTWGLTSLIAFSILATGIAHMNERRAGPGLPVQGPQSYAVSSLLRNGQATPSAVTDQDRIDAGLVLMQARKEGKLSDADKEYLTQLVETRTGLAAPDAEKRVNDTITQAESSEAIMHKNAGIGAIFAFLSLWVGAFIGSAAGALGGLHRDSHYHTGKLNP